MKDDAFQQALDAMAALHGCVGCALADAETGMVWLHAGPADFIPRAEAATDYWRLCLRHHAPFEALGGLRAQVSIHQASRLTLVACGSGLLLVCQSQEPDRVDWQAWRAQVGRLHEAAAQL